MGTARVKLPEASVCVVRPVAGTVTVTPPSPISTPKGCLPSVLVPLMTVPESIAVPAAFGPVGPFLFDSWQAEANPSVTRNRTRRLKRKEFIDALLR